MNPTGIRACFFRCLFIGLITHGVVSCADSISGTVSNPADPASASGPVKERISLLRDGFEGSSLANFWLPGNYGSGLYVPGAIQLTTNVSRSGSQSVKITIHEGDVAAAGDAGTTVERDELDSGHYPLMGREAWYGFSFLIPKNFPIVDQRLVISSCKQSDVSRPLTAERYRNGKHTFTIESQGHKKSYKLPPIPLGHWVDMVFQSRYATGDDGLAQVWMNGKLVVSYHGPLADPKFKNAFYHKIGLYRDRMAQPMTIYYDNYTMGNSHAEVDPARFDQNLGAQVR